eukprot:5837396-Pyramimonas_sp.AAC.1
MEQAPAAPRRADPLLHLRRRAPLDPEPRAALGAALVLRALVGPAAAGELRGVALQRLFRHLLSAEPIGAHHGQLGPRDAGHRQRYPAPRRAGRREGGPPLGSAP